jgi:tetratricopeptide (TPR) repeat protein
VSDAEAANDRAFQIGLESGEGEAPVVHGGQPLQIRSEQGRLGEIAELIEQTVEQSPAVPELRATLAFALRAAGRLEDAQAMLDREVATNFATVARTNIWLPAMGQWANTVVAVEHWEAAEVLYRELLPFTDQVMMVFVVVMGSVARSVGCLARLLGRYDEAETHLEAALALHRRLRAPYWIACTQLDLADLLFAGGAAGDAERAGVLPRDASTAAERYGYGALVQRAGPPSS